LGESRNVTATQLMIANNSASVWLVTEHYTRLPFLAFV
jgi:hypothetical protein